MLLCTFRHFSSLSVAFGTLKAIETFPDGDSGFAGKHHVCGPSSRVNALRRFLISLGTLRTLDLSFNLLQTIPAGLRHLQKLKTVDFVQDRISTISGLESLGATLTSLELGGNKIRVCPG